MSLPSIPFNKASAVGNELRYVEQAILSGKLAGDGEFSRRCHNWIHDQVGGAGALLTHSCTAALEMACILADLAPGDEVILPSYTFASTANAVALRGATPVFVDIRPDTLNIDETLIEAAITSKTKAIIAVHYAGVVAEMDAIQAIAAEHKLVVIEDAAQALLSTYHGRPAGSLSDAAAFSFHETKNLVSGEGGALTLRSPQWLKRAEIIREKGTNRKEFFRGAVDKYSWVDIGSSYLPGELVAAFLFAQLEQAEQVTAERRQTWIRYYDALADVEAAGLARRPRVPEHCRHNGHMFYLLLSPGIDAVTFVQALKERGIVAPSHYVPLHSTVAGRRYGRISGPMAVTDDIAGRLVRLPLFVGAGAYAENVIDAVREILHGAWR